MKYRNKVAGIVAAWMVLAFSQVCGKPLTARPAIVAGEWDAANGSFLLHQYINGVVGADAFYNAGLYGRNARIANVEAGHVWGDHEVFDRSGMPAEWGIAPSPSR